LGPRAYPRRAAELRCAALRGVSASLVAARPRRLPQCVGLLNTAAHVYGPRGVALGVARPGVFRCAVPGRGVPRDLCGHPARAFGRLRRMISRASGGAGVGLSLEAIV
jgi:hypothetical protein